MSATMFKIPPACAVSVRRSKSPIAPLEPLCPHAMAEAEFAADEITKLCDQIAVLNGLSCKPVNTELRIARAVAGAAQRVWMRTRSGIDRILAEQLGHELVELELRRAP